jgi:hypothetical protein
MVETLDQIFVTLKHQAVAFSPDAWQPLVSALISVALIPLVFANLFAIVTIFERKGIGRIQNRYGPNRVGIPLTKIRLCGFGQFIPDGLKMLTKEDIVPRAADKVVHFLAPVVLLIPVLLAYAVLPMGRNMTAVDLDAGVLFFFAVGVHGRLVEPQQILPAGRHARDCADDQLRNPAHPFRRHGDHDCWFAQDGGNRCGAKSLHLWAGALVCIHAVGFCRVHPVLHRVACGIQPHAV